MQERLHMSHHPGTNPPPFEASIIDVTDDSLILSQSYCYPRGGGQPGDTGLFIRDGIGRGFSETLGGEFIRHPVDEIADFSVGDEVSCLIDGERRNRHASMHTAQHIISALADDLWGAETVGNQISTEYTRIDFLFPNRDEYDSETLADAVNSVIGSGTLVNVHEWPRDAVKEHEHMRHTNFMERIPSSITELRVVEIEGIDLCPCAGTHVGSTNDLEPIVITSVKSKGAGKFRITYRFENEIT